LIGELDMAAFPALGALLAHADDDIELDCSGLTFIDCAGLQWLKQVRRACEAGGVRLTLISPSPCLTRLLDLVGLDGFFDVRDRSRS
jgi:anti-anti-sigma factor